MRNLIFTAVAVCFFVAAGAQADPVLPAGAQALETRLMTRIGPQTRGWIKQEAARQNSAGIASELTARNAIKANPSLRGLPDGDINALVFLVMMEASRSAREDLKAIMSGLKQINDARASLQKDAPQAARTAGSQNTSPAKVAALPVQPTPIPKAQFAKQLQAARNNRDSLSEMGEMESLRLQASMDKLSKADAATSEVMKKFSDSSHSISQNLK